jgi:hypothetical protein
MAKKPIILMIALGCALAGSEYLAEVTLDRGFVIKDAEARIGRPLTPVSVAGVARRTTRRAIVATSVYVAALPSDCTTVVVEGTSLYQCGTTYYQSSGGQYVVVNVE